MHIVAVHQSIQPLATLHTAENQSLHGRALLSGTPCCNVKGNRDVGFSDLLICGPARSPVLAVANRYGLDEVQGVEGSLK